MNVKLPDPPEIQHRNLKRGKWAGNCGKCNLALANYELNLNPDNQAATCPRCGTVNTSVELIRNNCSVTAVDFANNQGVNQHG